MIDTLYSTNALGSMKAFLVAAVIGFFLGNALEQPGCGSSRRLTGVFYFRDMTLLKVLASGVATALLGVSYCMALGWLSPRDVALPDTIYAAAILGGLILGAGLVVGGWSPGTAVVGAASGKIDALLFLAGAFIGNLIFNEAYPAVKRIYGAGNLGVVFAYDTLHVPRSVLIVAITVAAVGVFWGSEYLEKKRGKGGKYHNSSFLQAFSGILIAFSVGLFFIGGTPVRPKAKAAVESSAPAPLAKKMSAVEVLRAVEKGDDRIAPEELADRLMAAKNEILLIDLRTSEAFKAFHILGAVNVPMSRVPEYAGTHKSRGVIVLYGNDMTRAAEARDVLAQQGFTEAYVIEGGLEGFMRRCLEPASLRDVPVSAEEAERIRARREYFLKK